MILEIDHEAQTFKAVLVTTVKDRDGEIIDYESTKPLLAAAIAERNGMFPLRIMHQMLVVGVLKNIRFDDRRREFIFTFHIPEPDQFDALVAGVYNDVAIGGVYVKKWIEGDGVHYTADIQECSLFFNPGSWFNNPRPVKPKAFLYPVGAQS